MFKPETISQGIDSVVGPCNGLTSEQRMTIETPLFARAILRAMPDGCNEIIDYGCGVGRLAKAVLELAPDRQLHIVGADTSIEERKLAHAYVSSPRFVSCHPNELPAQQFKLAYVVYVLQHIPAIALRDSIRLIWHALADDGVLVHCSSDIRMAMSPHGFVDDRSLGVDLTSELGQYFEVTRPLFSSAEIEGSEVLRKMISGSDGGIPHPATVYRRRPQPVAPAMVDSLDSNSTSTSPQPDAQASFDKGKAAMDVGQIDQAIELFTEAMRLAPSSPVPLVGLAMAHGKKFELDVSERYASQSLKLGPSADAYAQMVHVHAQREARGPLHAAINAGLRLDPNHQSLLFARGMQELCEQNWEMGWRDWEHRETHIQQRDNMTKLLPMAPEWKGWKGETISGRLLVLGEHGLGDKILFLRYLPMLSRYAHYVDVLPGQDELNELVRVNAGSLGVDLVIAQKESITLTPADRWVSIESLPFLLDVPLPTRMSRYLSADRDQVSIVNELMPTGRPRVGVCWRGSQIPEPYRSMEWEEFAPLVQSLASDWDVISLQQNLPCPDEHVDSTLISQSEHMADTATIISNLDMVISVDTGVAHLAAALGVPTCVLRPRPPEWRWGSGPRSPWYGDHVHVCVQATRGVWGSVLEEALEWAAKQADKRPDNIGNRATGVVELIR